MNVIETARGVPLLLSLNRSLNDRKRGELIRRTLLAAAPESIFVDGIEEGRRRIESSNISALIICDWEPDGERLRFLSRLRKMAPDLPILVIGSTDIDDDRVAAFETGADNYLSASFSEREIKAKLDRLLRRRDEYRPSLRISDLQVWSESHVVFRDGIPIKLSAKEMEILMCLAASRSRPVSRSQLLRDVFGLPFETGTNVVEVHIHRLRQKIDRGHGRKLLKTVRGQGYVLG